MFKEMFRRSYLEKVFQNIFVSKLLIPKPFAECTYYYANVKDKVKKYKLKKKSSDKFRLMEKKDVKDVYNLISNSQKQFKIYSIFSEEEIEHWFIPIKNVIYSFVKEDENNNITDFTSFYVVNALIDNMKEKWCYIYFNIATSMSSEKLFENALVLAEQSGIDYYIGNSINNYENILKKYKFNSNIEDEDSYGSLKYYFNNFLCPETDGKDISIILI
jgi:glycylpeptide N-tetradecanoyltransferase